jgi:hypothetical protein
MPQFVTDTSDQIINMGWEVLSELPPLDTRQIKVSSEEDFKERIAEHWGRMNAAFPNEPFKAVRYNCRPSFKLYRKL